MLTVAGGVTERPRRGARDGEWDTGLDETAGGTGHENPALYELLKVEDRRSVQYRASRDAKERSVFQHFGGGVLDGVVVDRVQKFIAAGEALDGGGQVGIVEEVRPPDHDEEILKLLGAVSGEDGESV